MPTTTPQLEPAVIGLLGCCILGLAMLVLLSVGVNRERACAVSRQQILDVCPQYGPGTAEEAAALRSRIARNPGDTDAYVALALNDRSERHAQLISAALALAPSQPNLLIHHSALALERQDWETAAHDLVRVAEHHIAPAATQVLAQMIAAGKGDLLVQELKPRTQWLGRVLTQMQNAQAPLSSALPLVVRAMKLGILDADAAHRYVRDLKAAKAWADAYSLWLSIQGKPMPALFNGSFDDAFQADGFDWEIPMAGPQRRVGTIVERRGADERGTVLDLQFTGRPVALPIIRQQLFLAPGHYRLRGEHLGRQFRSEGGLAWSVDCAGQPAGKSPPLGDTQGSWRKFEFEFDVRPACGLVVTLQLETQAVAEAVLGARGRVAFDAFSLEKLPQ